MGLQKSVVYKMAVATHGRPLTAFQPARVHLENLERGFGTIFNDAQERRMVEAFRRQQGDSEVTKSKGWAYYDRFFVLPDDQHHPENSGYKKIKSGPKALQSLYPSTRNEVMRQWIAGHYSGPTPAEKGDTLSQVAASARRNETYLPADAQKLSEKLGSLIPSQMRQPRSGKVKSSL
jgi:hypothetical protein